MLKNLIMGNGWLNRYFMDSDDGSGGGGSDGDSGSDESNSTDGDTGDVIELPAGRGRKIKLPSTIDGIDVRKVLDYHMATVRKQGSDEFEKKYTELIDKLGTVETKNKELEELIQKHEDDKLSAEEKVKRGYERQIKERDDQIAVLSERSTGFQTRYESERINNELYKALSKYDIYNMNQAKELLKVDGRVTLVESEDGTDKVMLKLNIDGVDEEFTPEEGVKVWLDNPENLHHMKANVRSGSGTTGYGNARNSNGAKVYTLEQWQRVVSEAKPDERQKLMKEKASGKIVINN